MFYGSLHLSLILFLMSVGMGCFFLECVISDVFLECVIFDAMYIISYNIIESGEKENMQK